MYSRAHLLIQKEINEISGENDLSIIKLDENNIFELVALIEGPPKTIWENGIFQIYMKFSENYNFLPPKVYFQTIPYHPNIDITTGKPSVDFLDDITKWKQDYSIKYILKNLQQLLSNPLLDRSVNMDAVFMLKGNPKQYAALARQSVFSTQKIRKMLKEIESLRKDGLDSDSFSSLVKNFQLFKLEKEPTQIIRTEIVDIKNESFKTNKQFPVSFDEYSKLWKGIATTKSNKNEENVYLKNELLQKPSLMSQHISISIAELEHQINKQLNEHKNIMYGRFTFDKKFNKTSENETETKLQEKDKKPKVVNYNELNKFNPINESVKIKIESPVRTQLFVNQDDDIFEQEVDELINWTKNIE